jgi:GAF domain-containing protein/HAMP domain-containing protein
MLEDKIRQQDQRTEEYQRKIAIRITLITFALILIVAIVNWFFVPDEDKTPIDNYAMPVMAFSAGLSYLLARRADHIRAIYLLLGSIALTASVYPLAADNVGWQAAMGMLVIITSIANSTLPSRAAGRISAAAFLLAIFIIVIDLYVDGITHLPVTTSSIVITSLLVLVYAGIVLARFRLFSLRTKLIIAFMAVSIASVVAVAFTISRSILAQLTSKVEQELTGVASLTASSLTDEIDKQVDLLRTVALYGTLDDELARINVAATGNETELEQLDQQWRNADVAGNDDDPLVNAVLNHSISAELREFRSAFPEHVEVFVTDRYGGNVAATNRTSDYYQADEEWWQAAYNNGQGSVYISQPQYDESSQTFALLFAVPVVNSETGEVVGVLRTTVNLNLFLAEFEAGRFGQTGRTEIYLPNETELEVEKEANGDFSLKLEEAPADFKAALQKDQAFMDTTHDGVLVLAAQSSLTVPRTDEDSEDFAALERLHWRVVTLQDRAEALRLVADASRNAQLVGLGALLVAGLLAVAVARFLTDPIVRLTAVAEKVSTGDLQTRAPIESSDEIGILADSFNRMTSQLQDTLGGMERRVAERTADLQLARLLSDKRAQELQSISEISRLISSEQKLEILLPLITRLVSEKFSFYHVGIFFIDSTRRYVVLQAANSPGGQTMLERGHRLGVGQTGIVGNVALTGKTRIALDVESDPVFFNNPDLPDTHSEMALPLNVRGETIGVLDIQSTKPGAFTENDANTLGILADQIATALENARLFGQNQQALEEVQTLYSQYLRTEWLSFTRRETNIGYHQSLVGGKPLTALVESGEIHSALQRREVVVLEGDNGSQPSIVIPVKLRGQVIGTLIIKAPTKDRKWNQDEINLAQAITDRLALALDNARLLQESQRRASKEAKIGEVTAKIGASINMRNVLQTAVEELGRALPGSEVVIQFQSAKENGSK